MPNYQPIAEPLKPFAKGNGREYYLHENEVYSMIENSHTAYDLLTGMPLSSRWECSFEHFNNFKSVYITK